MVVVEITPNPNCDPVDLRVFNDVEPPRRVAGVCLEYAPGHSAWFDITGWTADGTPVPAQARRVDDSGEGLAVLVTGGTAGLRLRRAGSGGAWRLDDADQRGESFLLLADDGSVRFEADGAFA
jgi:hypothetical protein